MMMPVRRTGIGRLGDQSITDIITQAAQAQGVPVSLALAQAQRESGMNPNATGALGEQGLFQLRPEFFAQNGNLFDPVVNSNVALAFLYQQYQHTGNWNDALIAYNEGPTNWDNGLRSAKAVSYASAILTVAGMAGGTTTPPAMPAPGQLPPAQGPGYNFPQPSTSPPVNPQMPTDWATIGLIAIGAVVAVNVLS